MSISSPHISHISSLSMSNKRLLAVVFIMYYYSDVQFGDFYQKVKLVWEFKCELECIFFEYDVGFVGELTCLVGIMECLVFSTFKASQQTYYFILVFFHDVMYRLQPTLKLSMAVVATNSLYGLHTVYKSLLLIKYASQVNRDI